MLLLLRVVIIKNSFFYKVINVVQGCAKVMFIAYGLCDVANIIKVLHL